MKNYNKRNLFFDDLHNQKDLKWLGQNTNHFNSHDYVISEMIQSIKTFFVVFQISLGLCSTHPSLGKYCLNSFCEEYILLPDRLNNIALLDVVP